jgi:hypothetical protein
LGTFTHKLNKKLLLTAYDSVLKLQNTGEVFNDEEKLKKFSGSIRALRSFYGYLSRLIFALKKKILEQNHLHQVYQRQHSSHHLKHVSHGHTLNTSIGHLALSHT